MAGTRNGGNKGRSSTSRVSFLSWNLRTSLVLRKVIIIGPELEGRPKVWKLYVRMRNEEGKRGTDVEENVTELTNA